jgi:hypothetical protein
MARHGDATGSAFVVPFEREPRAAFAFPVDMSLVSLVQC